MCGIVGYVGTKPAVDIILNSLEKLEYRGYDSAGIALRGFIDTYIKKSTGRLSNLRLAIKSDNLDLSRLKCGIGHTRWATHGAPTEDNSHPHFSGCKSNPNIIGVHNGIIDNFSEIKDKLINLGYEFYSDTDTEVLIKLIDYYYNKYKLGPIDAINRSLVRVTGSYALSVIFKDCPNQIFVARKDSPLIIGVGEHENFIASDAPAISKYTNKVYYLKNLQSARITSDSVEFYDLNGYITDNELITVNSSTSDVNKGIYSHFMMKEIMEQPEVISNYKNIEIDKLFDITKYSKIHIVACGSSYHAGLIGKVVIERYYRIPVEVYIASEYKYDSDIIFNENSDLAIFISQSGETADTLASLRKIKNINGDTLAIVNVKGSSLDREAMYSLITNAGTEVAVATTKAYLSQIYSFISFAIPHGTLPIYIIKDYLKDHSDIQKLSTKLIGCKDIYFIGRGIDYYTCLEGSLKLKEVSYIHSEAYPAGELKHGTISLIEEGTPVIALATTNDTLISKTISNLVECKSRGAYTILITNSDVNDSVADYIIRLPKLEQYHDIFMPIISILPLQLLAYYVSVSKGIDPDKPRNLAKSVTVE